MSEVLTGSDLDGMVNRYLAELSAALTRLPTSRRDHLVSEIREHIAQLRFESPVRDRSDMEALLNRVGLPEDIAAVALEGEEEDTEVVGPVAPVPALPHRYSFTRRSVVTVLGVSAGLILLIVVLAGAFGVRSHSVFFAQSAAPFAVEKGGQRIHIIPGVPPFTFTVPNVVGESTTAAEETMVGAGLPVATQDIASTSVPSGHVIAQVPAGGSSVTPGTAITIVVSSGPPA
jgi:uncharacterized membrane protein